MNGPKLTHQRSWERVRHTCLAWIEGKPEAASRGIARTIDLSPNGAGLVLSAPFEAGTTVVVELLLPGSLRLRAAGEVVHSTRLDDQYRVGVRFFEPPVLIDSARREEG